MLENRMALPIPPKHFIGACPTCEQEFESADRGAQVKLHPCPHPGCRAEICEWCRDNKATFVCAECLREMCKKHELAAFGDTYCLACLEKLVPAFARTNELLREARGGRRAA